MKIQKYLISVLIAACVLVVIPPIQAVSDDTSTTVIYQTSFTSNPNWQTNNPTTNYWDPNLGMYRFSLEPSTGGYAFTPIDYERGSFNLDYDLMLTRIDDGATFRFGMAGSEMDPSKAPNVLTLFTNNQAKYGQIMWIHLVTPGSKLMEVSSQTSTEPGAYNGPTVKYELNKTYHISLKYDDDRKSISMNVNDKYTGKEIWSYYLNTAENLNGMNTLYLGSKGDYGMMGIYAQGYLDNVRLTAPSKVTVTPTVVTTAPAFTTNPTTKPTTKQTTAALTPYPTTTQESPSAGILAIAALGIAGVCGVLVQKKKD
jgi:hypothetical protein